MLEEVTKSAKDSSPRPHAVGQAGSSHIRSHLIVLAAYLLLALALTYPLILHLTTHVPGDGRDDPPLVWNLWWVPYSLLNLHTSPLTSSYMFFPIGINLTYFTLTILNGLLSIPLQAVGGLVLASNIELIASYVIAAFGTYLLVLDLLRFSDSRGLRDSGNLKDGLLDFSDSRSLRDFGNLQRLAAFVAGLVYAFAPIKMIFASLGQFNMASTQWIPFFVLYLLRATRPLEEPSGLKSAKAGGQLRCFIASIFPHPDRQARRAAFMAAIFLLFEAYSEFTFASFLVIFTAVYLLYLLVTRRNATLTRWMIGRLSILAAVFLIGFWPILGSMLRQIAVEGDYSLSAGWGFADIFAADLLGFFVPSTLHPLLGAFAQQVTRNFSYTNFASVGFVVLVLAVVGLLARRWQQRTHTTLPVSFWGMSALLYAILSLGPVLHIAGRWIFNLDGLQVRVPLLFIILHYIPFIKANRYPSRLQVLVVLCLAVLAGYGVAAILNRTQKNADKAQANAERKMSGSVHLRPVSVGQRSMAVVTALVAAAILFEYLAIPLPLSDMRVPDVYKQIAQDNGNAPLLQLPISWRNSFQFIPQSFTALPQNVNTVVMFEQFYQTSHLGPILSGNTSRNPEFKFTYFLEAPVIRTIIALEEGRPVSPEQVAYDRSIMPEVLRFFGFKYIVLHPPMVGGPLEDYIRSVFPVEPIPADAGLSAYRVIAPPAVGRLTIDMSSDMSNLYRAEGWGEPQQIDGQLARWTDRLQARLMVPLTGSASASLTIDLLHAAVARPVEIQLNGHVLYTIDSGPLPRPLTVTVPAGVGHAGLNDLIISVPRLDGLGPAEGRQPYTVGQTGVNTGANIVVHSAGLDAGGDLGFAHIYVNGKDAITGQRGFNVAVIDPATGAVQQTANFDVLGDPAANSRFLDFVKAAPSGKIVAVAVMDDASINFNDPSAQALRLIGAQVDLTGRLRNSYAAIGVKGAAPGQALEQWAQGRPASVALGAYVFGKGLGVAISSVTIEQ